MKQEIMNSFDGLGKKFNEELHSLLELDFDLRTFLQVDGHEKFLFHRNRVVNLMSSCATFKTELLDGLEMGLHSLR